ncbi:helix-turn-helix domain-containing protein [Lactococcus carnosus]|uniref:helix-turn-helix domain-containing protein n=1 Tax=Pseudolactococcus carnosus TaxID=2749961 RepID=UPI001FB8F655|nr:helix-turn-helix transcriptional regulator [Lactococcus carnosus]
MPKNKIKLLRKSIPLTLKELAEKTNKNLEMRYDSLRDQVTEDDPEFRTLKKIQVTDSQLSHYENGKRTPRHSIIWRALADVFDVPLTYLLGFSELTEEIHPDISEESKIKQSEISKDFHQYFLKTVVDEKSRNDFFYLVYRLNQSNLKDFEVTLKEFLGTKKFNIFKEQYTIHVGSQKNDRTYFNILESLMPLMSGNNQIDLQLMLTFIQLNKKNQAKALEQVKNLLIVQNATENNKDKDT